MSARFADSSGIGLAVVYSLVKGGAAVAVLAAPADRADLERVEHELGGPIAMPAGHDFCD